MYTGKNKNENINENNEIKAMRLWSDWNSGLKKWAKEKVATVCIDVCMDI